MTALMLRALLWVLTRALPVGDTECPICGPTDPYDDCITPRDGDEDGPDPDPDRLELDYEAERRGIEDGRRDER